MWIVKEVSIEDIGLTPHTYCDVSLKKFPEYAKMPKDTAPPIDTVLKDGKYEIANGLHRYAAALVRGDKTIMVSFWEL